jgi:hypothetical protein
MASNVHCGSCGAPLEHPSAPCRACGVRPRWGPARTHKSPSLAAALAIIPGVGHLYVGDYAKGAGFMATTGLMQFVGFDLDLTAIGALAGVPIELGGVGVWLFSIYDAYRSARRHNQGL